MTEISKAVLITNITGQDGTYLAELLLSKGFPRKLLSVDTTHRLYWQVQTALREGIAKAYADFLSQVVN